MPVDIIIPVLNEEKILRQNAAYYRSLGQKARVIFVDGGSRDQTCKIARGYGQVIISKPGRGRQKNIGAQQATGSYLLFLHVDSFLSDAALEKIEQSLSNGTDAGCLTLKIQDKNPVFRLYENIVNFRANRFGVTDGDSGLFIKRKIFESIGCFDECPIMEDILIGKKLRNVSKVQKLAYPIFVSSRKWRERGFAKTFLSYSLAYIQMWTKIPFFKDPLK